MSETDTGGALRLLLQFVRAQESDDPHAFRFEPQDYILPTAGGDSPSARFDWTPAVLSDLQALALPGRDPARLQRVGELLRRFVLAAGFARHEAAISQALSQGRAVVVTIRSAAAELYALPWELLTLKDGRFLGEVDGLLLRFEWPESPAAPERPQPRPAGGRILFAWSTAGGAVPVESHQSALARACADGMYPFDASTDILPHASLDRLAQRLESAERQGPPISVLHLLCHGGAAGSTFGLMLDGDGGAMVADAIQVRQRLARFAGMVRLVVLSACDSGNPGSLGNRLGSIAQTLHRSGFACVVASRFPLSVDGSIALTEALYGELLCRPAGLEAGFLAARKRLCHDAVSQTGSGALDWASLQLYARHDDGDDSRPLVFRPYRGLLAFQPEHSRFFFGRDAEIEAAKQLLRALSDQNRARFLVVVGASGTGKSSLVLSGVVPELLKGRPGLCFVRMRPGRDPERALSEALAPRNPTDKTLLVVDQFEELFTQIEQPALRSAFAQRLWALASAADSHVQILVTLRVDFLGRCGELVLDATGLRLDRIVYDDAHRLFVSQLQPAELRAAIVEPARKVGLLLEPGLADRMLSELGREPGALPLLQDALDVLWQHRRGRTLTQAAYDALGGVVGALQRRADALLEALAPPDLETARRLLTSLVAVADDTAQDTRLRLPLADVMQSLSGAGLASLARVLKEMSDARLLVQSGDGHSAEVEIAHEALIRKWPRLRSWLDEDREGLLFHRRVKQAAQQWERQQRDESLLYRGGQLAAAAESRTRWGARLGPLEQQFLDESQAESSRMQQREAAQQEKERQRARQLRVVAAVLALLLVFALGSYLKAVAESAKARAGLIDSVALALKDDPTSAAMVLRDAGHRDSSLWRQVAIDTLQSPIAREVVRAPGPCARALAFGEGGKQVVCQAPDHSAIVFRTDGTSAPVVLSAHRDEVVSAAFSPDGSLLITGSADATARVFRADGTAALNVFPIQRGSVDAVAFSADGRRVVFTGEGTSAIVAYVDGSGSPIVLRGDQSGVTAAAFSRDGKKVALGYGAPENLVRVFRTDGVGEPVQLAGHDHAVTTVAFDPAGQRVITGSRDHTARIFKADGKGEPIVLKGFRGAVVSAAFFGDGKRVVTASLDQTLRIFTTEGVEEPLIRKGQTNLAYVEVSADGKQLLSGSSDGTQRRWDLVQPPEPRILKEDIHEVLAVAFSSDGSRLLSGFTESVVRRYDARAPGAGTEVLPPPEVVDVLAMAFSPDGQRVAISDPYSVTRIHPLKDSGTGKTVELRGHQSYVRALAFSRDGTRIVSGSDDKTARIWSTDGARAPVILSGHEGPVSAVAFSPDGKRVATGSSDKTVRVWNSDGTGSVTVLRGHAGPVTAVAFGAGGAQVVSGSADQSVRLWKLDGNHAAQLRATNAGEVSSVAFSPDGKLIAVGSADRTVRVIPADGAGETIVLRRHGGSVSSVAWSPDGERLASGSEDTTVALWTVGSQTLLSSLWAATTDCLPAERRYELLRESLDDARKGHARCLQEVAERKAARPAGSAP